MGPPWLYDGLSREELEEKVTSFSTESGTFAVRKLKARISMCVVYKGKPTHHVISKDAETGTFEVNKKQFGSPKSLNQVHLLCSFAVRCPPCPSPTS